MANIWVSMVGCASSALAYSRGGGGGSMVGCTSSALAYSRGGSSRSG